MIELSVGIIGVGRLGSDVALTLAERDLCDIVLYDQVTEKAEYLASDLTDTSFGHVYNRRVSWASQLRDLARCDVILLAAGAPMKPGTKSEELFAANREIVAELADAFVGSSNLFVVATEPIDLMTAELRRALRLPAGRVLGIGGVVDSFRVRHAIGDALAVNPDYVRTHVIGPNSADAQILWDFTAVNGVPVSMIASGEVIAEVERSFTEDAKDRLERMKESTSRYAPAMACFELLRAIVKDDRRIMSVTMEWTNTLDISNVAMSVPAVVGRFGVDRVVIPELPDKTQKLLEEMAKSYSSLLTASIEVTG